MHLTLSLNRVGGAPCAENDATLLWPTPRDNKYASAYGRTLPVGGVCGQGGVVWEGFWWGGWQGTSVMPRTAHPLPLGGVLNLPSDMSQG
jgi:hypothetical protein